MDSILERAQVRKAGEILRQYARREPAAVVLVEELVASANVSIDSFMGDALAERLEDIERIDRLATIAENRRTKACARLSGGGPSSLNRDQVRRSSPMNMR